MNLRYTPIPSELFIHNRKNFTAKMLAESVLVVKSNDVIPTNADGTLGFKQNSDLYYLTGIDQEETSLWLCPDHPEAEFREVLFIKETNEHIKIWEGEKLTKEEASQLSGIKTILWDSQFESFLQRHIFHFNTIYLTDNEHDGKNKSFQTQNRRLIDFLKFHYPLHQFQRAAPILSALRLLKHPLEIEAILKAVEITRKGFEAMSKKLKAGVFEFELEAELTYTFLKNRSRNHAFQPIVASGKNACVLHYITNYSVCKNGESVLLDFGAEYANYNADITRCLPVSGNFTPRQREIYLAVLHIFKEARSRMVIGKTFQELRDEVAELMKEKLFELRLLTKQDLSNASSYKKYFPHGISHHLGLDVHDVGDKYRTFEAGMVLTCEPGIYIPAEEIGIRLENDILITANGNEDLMKSIPIEIDEIEAIFQNLL